MKRPSPYLTVPLSLGLVALWSGPLAAQRFERMIVLSDSSSETGNVQFLSQGSLPPWPAYYEGRWSNGPVWVEFLADRLGLPNPEASLKGGTNYAYSGAETGSEWTSEAIGFPVPGLGLQLDEFLAHDQPAGDDLFVLYGGYNDLGPGGQTNVQVLIDNLTAHAERLTDAGARHFLVGSLAGGDAAAEAFNSGWSQASQQLDRDLAARFYWYDAQGTVRDLFNNREALGLSFDGQALDPVTGQVADDPNSYVCWDSPWCHLTTPIQERYAQDAYTVLAPFVGDYSRDGAITVRDLDLLSRGVRTSPRNRQYDLNTDDVVNDLDRQFWVGTIASTVFGDANLDRKVDLTDFDLLKSAFSRSEGWGAGEFSGDGKIDLTDFGLLKANFGQTAGYVPVPEPCGFALAATSLLALAAFVNLRGGNCRWAQQLH